MTTEHLDDFLNFDEAGPPSQLESPSEPQESAPSNFNTIMATLEDIALAPRQQHDLHDESWLLFAASDQIPHQLGQTSSHPDDSGFPESEEFFGSPSSDRLIHCETISPAALLSIPSDVEEGHVMESHEHCQDAEAGPGSGPRRLSEPSDDEDSLYAMPPDRVPASQRRPVLPLAAAIMALFAQTMLLAYAAQTPATGPLERDLGEKNKPVRRIRPYAPEDDDSTVTSDENQEAPTLHQPHITDQSFHPSHSQETVPSVDGPSSPQCKLKRKRDWPNSAHIEHVGSLEDDPETSEDDDYSDDEDFGAKTRPQSGRRKRLKAGKPDAKKLPRKVRPPQEIKSERLLKQAVPRTPGPAPSKEFACQARCGDPDNEEMVLCDNEDHHGVCHWWHYACVPYATSRELPQGEAQFFCPPCIDAGFLPATYKKPEIMPPGKKVDPRVKGYSKSQLADQTLFPNPLLDSNFYRAPRADSNGWSEREQRACIFQMKRLEPRWRGPRTQLFGAVSIEMARMQEVFRPENAVKIWWHRNGRERSGHDERDRVKKGYEHTLSTSLQGQSRAQAAGQRKATSSSPPEEAQPSLSDDGPSNEGSTDGNKNGPDEENSPRHHDRECSTDNDGLAAPSHDSGINSKPERSTDTTEQTVSNVSGAETSNTKQQALSPRGGPIAAAAKRKPSGTPAGQPSKRPKTTGLGKGKGGPRKLNRAPPAQKQPRKVPQSS